MTKRTPKTKKPTPWYSIVIGWRIIVGALSVLLSGIAVNSTAATQNEPLAAPPKPSLDDVSEEADLCTPEFLALADFGALPGSFVGCISDEETAMEILLEKLASQPVLPGGGLLKNIHHKPGHYDNGGGNGCENGCNDNGSWTV